jgi:signal transduction histidine kinase
MKQEVAAAIETAKYNLDRALAGLDHIEEAPQAVLYIAQKLQNYLAVAAAGADLLSVYLAGRPEEEPRVWAEAMQHAIQLMKQEANRLLSSTSGCEVPVKLERVDLGVLAFRACNFYRRKAALKSIELMADVEPERFFACTDRVTIAATFDNLLSNAIKLSPCGGRVWLTARHHADRVSISVRDEGAGFAEADKRLLFEKDARLSNSQIGGEVPPGFGLPIAKELVERAGGQIVCESEPGNGATFTVSLPAYNDGCGGELNGRKHA